MRTRRATASDAPWLVQEVARWAYETHNERLLPADPDEAGRIWLNWIENHFVAIAEDGPTPCGFVMAWKSHHPFNPAVRALTCGLWVVNRAYRKSRAGVLLVDALDRYADRHADVVYFTLQRGSGDRMMARRGYTPLERDFERWTTQPKGVD
jgi:hypothetical protein